MKKSIAVILCSYFVAATAAVSVSAYEAKLAKQHNLALASNTQQSSTYSEKQDISQDQAQPAVSENSSVMTASIASQDLKDLQSKAATASKQVLSRGGSSVPKTSEKATQKAAAPIKGSVEVLDWWKQAKNVFKIGSTAVVEDVRTGKTFKIVRTMGSNHADCEAASKADADIIKSIWGGFSWDVRPVIINVSGRRLAASMSSLPHAGVDSAPAFATVNNRSEGYGTGENLDVIKGNGMNGHFDVHFLNSTRHKDGQVDPRHQAAIKIAAKK